MQMNTTEIELFEELAVLLTVHLVQFKSEIDVENALIKGKEIPHFHQGDFQECIHLLQRCQVVGPKDEVLFDVTELRDHIAQNVLDFGVELSWLVERSMRLMGDYAEPLKGVLYNAFFEVPHIFNHTFDLLVKCEFATRHDDKFKWADKTLCLFFGYHELETPSTKKIYRAEISEIWDKMPSEVKSTFATEDTSELARLVANHWYNNKWQEQALPSKSNIEIYMCSPAFFKACQLQNIATAPRHAADEKDYQVEFELMYNSMPDDVCVQIFSVDDDEKVKMAESLLKRWSDGVWKDYPVQRDILNKPAFFYKPVVADLLFKMTGKEIIPLVPWSPIPHCLMDE